MTHPVYIVGGFGFLMLKLSRSRIDDAIDFNPVFRLGLGSEVRVYGDKRVDFELGYLPLKGPTYVVNSGYLKTRYVFGDL